MTGLQFRYLFISFVFHWGVLTIPTDRCLSSTLSIIIWCKTLNFHCLQGPLSHYESLRPPSKRETGVTSIEDQRELKMLEAKEISTPAKLEIAG